MTSATPDPLSPRWPHCGQGATAYDPVGCRGIHVTGHTACLAHLSDADRIAYLDGLGPGIDIDHRGTTFTTDLLTAVLNAVRAPTAGGPHLGQAWFEGATFTGDARFDSVTFTGDASFSGATFRRDASFARATFRDADFSGVHFPRDALFGEATFLRNARFSWVTFTGYAWFAGAKFRREADFDGVTLTDASFDGARFEGTQQLGPMRSTGVVGLSEAVFSLPVVVEVSARSVSLQRTRWESTAALRLRHAEVDLSGAVLTDPLTLTAEPTQFPVFVGGLPEDGEILDGDGGVQVADISGVDAAHLTLTDVDLSSCRFAGAIHLDQLRMEGRVTFAPPPTGWQRRGLWPARWSPRRSLAEEHHWRAVATGQPANHQPDASAATAGGPVDGRLWRTGMHHPDPKLTPGPETVAALYRQLRKALEDGKNEPGAADFYYGECEMRRHDHTSTPRVERVLLTVYWAVSGYGLRASRALAWLGVAMTATIVVMMLWGIPAEEPLPTITGRQVEAGQDLVLTTDSPPPVNPSGPLSERMSTDRFEKSLRVVINSVVFRSSGQDLTTTGTYTEMTTRMAEPVLLGLAVLAVRARIKR